MMFPSPQFGWKTQGITKHQCGTQQRKKLNFRTDGTFYASSTSGAGWAGATASQGKLNQYIHMMLFPTWLQGSMKFYQQPRINWNKQTKKAYIYLKINEGSNEGSKLFSAFLVKNYNYVVVNKVTPKSGLCRWYRISHLLTDHRHFA